MADDPRSYRAERAEYERGRAIVQLLVRATGCYREPTLPRVDDALRKARAIEHWAAWVRNRREGFLGDPRWQPNAHFLKRIAAAGITWAELEEQLRG